MNLKSPKRQEWTPSIIRGMDIRYYPLCESGPVFQFLDDELLMYDIYVKAGSRSDVKAFCKVKQWPGKPMYQLVTEKALRQLIRSMCNSLQARRMLVASGSDIEFYSVLWRYVRKTDPICFEKINKFCYKEEDKSFIDSAGLRGFLSAIKLESPEISKSALYLTVAFGMLQPEFCPEFLSELFSIFPESVAILGLEDDSVRQSQECNDGKILDSDSASLYVSNEAVLERVEKNRHSDDLVKKQVDCWILNFEKFLIKADEFEGSSRNFGVNAERLLKIDRLESFVDAGSVVEVLSALEADRCIVRDNGSEIKKMMMLDCESRHSSGCEFQKIVLQSKSEPLSTREDVVRKIGELRAAKTRVLSNSELSVREISALDVALSYLSAQMGQKPATFLAVDLNAVPCHIFAMEQQRREEVGMAGRVLAEEVERQKVILTSSCDQLLKRSNSSFSRFSPAIFELRSRILLINSMDEIKRYSFELTELADLCSIRDELEIPRLAIELSNNPSLSDNFLTLCAALMDNDSAEIAFLLIHVWQRLHAYGEPALSVDAAVDMSLSSAVRASLGRLPVNAVWQALLLDPWLLGLGRGDLKSNDSVQRLVVALIGCALADEDGIASAILSNIGAVDVCRIDFPKSLQNLLFAMVERRRIKLITANESDKKESQVNDINERISVKNKKYRHLQCSNAVHFSRFEGVTVFPSLEQFWEEVSTALSNEDYAKANILVDSISVDEWYRELTRQHDRPVDEHPYFPVRIRAFMQEFVNLVREHSLYLEQLTGVDQFLVVETELVCGLENWANLDSSRKDLIKVVLQNLMLTNKDHVCTRLHWSAAAICRPILLKCPNFAIWIRSQERPEVDLVLEQLILRDLEKSWEIDVITEMLSENSAWLQLGILHPESSGLPDHGWTAKHQEDVAEFTRRREDVVAVQDQTVIQIFDECVRDSRFSAANEILNRCSEKNASSKSQEKVLVSSFVSDQLSIIHVIKDDASEANMSEQWQDDISGLCGIIERQLRTLRLSEIPSADEFLIERARLESAVVALRFVVDQRTNVLDEVRHYLAIATREGFYGARSPTPEDSVKANQKCPDLLKSWNVLSSNESDDIEIKRCWTQFVKEFSKICNLYRDESDERKRFASVTSIKLPFLVFQTAFHKPQSDFLKRPLRLYLYRQNDFDTPALQRLDAELNADGAAAWLHIVFAPHGGEKLRRFFRYDRGFKDFLIVDENLLYRISSLDKHDVPVRQALHLSVADLANSSPFVAQGYCHQTNNIYVGRKDILSKLLNTPQAMIWGGRRIGKTSVLHALESALGNRRYRVAYVYVDLQDNGDPDLAIAQKIGATLGLESINSITDFERQITSRRLEGERFAFLIDEVDEYIKKSRNVHGNEYPLATMLRQLVMDDSSKDTVLVYSGYHQLFYEAKLNKAKRRVGHPFINIAQDVPIRDLTHDDVAELVRTGFEEMLGIAVSPDVPSLISTRASRHPAFVQQFCRCLLEQVSKRRSPGELVTITKDDVEAVYQANASSDGGEQPFIFYVNETLGYNLSHLGRAIMIAICLDPNHHIKTDSGEKFFPIIKIRDELNVWCELIGIDNPESEHFQQSIDLLVMTNMLTPNPLEHGEYRVTYPTYIDILRRLDSIKRADVEGSLIEYDSKERVAGVLL